MCSIPLLYRKAKRERVPPAAPLLPSELTLQSIAGAASTDNMDHDARYAVYCALATPRQLAIVCTIRYWRIQYGTRDKHIHHPASCLLQRTPFFAGSCRASAADSHPRYRRHERGTVGLGFRCVARVDCCCGFCTQEGFSSRRVDLPVQPCGHGLALCRWRGRGRGYWEVD